MDRRLSRLERQFEGLSISVDEGGLPSADLQPDDEVNGFGNLALQQFQVTELLVQHQKSLAFEIHLANEALNGIDNFIHQI